MPFSEIIDPKNICKDVSNKGHLGNGEVEIKINNITKLSNFNSLAHVCILLSD